jgi:TPR repeat protein
MEGAGGVERNEGEGITWLRKSAEGGFLKGQAFYGQWLIYRGGGPKDIEAGVDWLRKAADNGNADAQFLYGLHFVQGKGTAINTAEAGPWFRYAALQGHAKGENAYGYWLVTESKGTENELTEACKWYTLAIRQTADAIARRDAEINLKALLPKLTPEQAEKGKQLADKFVPIREKKNDTSDDGFPGLG